MSEIWFWVLPILGLNGLATRWIERDDGLMRGERVAALVAIWCLPVVGLLIAIQIKTTSNNRRRRQPEQASDELAAEFGGEVPRRRRADDHDGGNGGDGGGDGGGGGD